MCGITWALMNHVWGQEPQPHPTMAEDLSGTHHSTEHAQQLGTAPASLCLGACLGRPQAQAPWLSMGPSVRHPKLSRGVTRLPESLHFTN